MPPGGRGFRRVGSSTAGSPWKGQRPRELVRALRKEFIHGIPDGLHHVDLYEDDEEVRVTVYLGLNHDWTGGGYVLIGIRAWATLTTARPVAHRYINDGADIL
jgi:hypothetical protein